VRQNAINHFKYILCTQYVSTNVRFVTFGVSRRPDADENNTNCPKSVKSITPYRYYYSVCSRYVCFRCTESTPSKLLENSYDSIITSIRSRFKKKPSYALVFHRNVSVFNFRRLDTTRRSVEYVGERERERSLPTGPPPPGDGSFSGAAVAAMHYTSRVSDRRRERRDGRANKDSIRGRVSSSITTARRRYFISTVFRASSDRKVIIIHIGPGASAFGR